MNLDQATAALAANSAALFLAGRDLDQIIAAVAIKPAESTHGYASQADLDFSNDSAAVSALRAAIDAAPDQVSKFMIVTNGIESLGATLAARETAKAADARAIAQARADQRAAAAEFQRKAALREQLGRAVHPVIMALRAQITRIEMTVGDVAGQADLDALRQDLADACANANAGIAAGVGAVLPLAA